MDNKKEILTRDIRSLSDAIIELNPDIIPKEEYEYFINILKDQIEKFLDAGQYKRVIKAFKVLESETNKNRLTDLAANTLQYYHSPQFFSSLINSLKIIGREKREDAFLLCEYFGEKIILPLIDALNDEESQSIRRFIISLITHFGKDAVPVAIKHLNDSRWFVKKNMLYILYKCGLETFKKDRRKRIWLYIAAVTVIVVTLVVISFVLFINANKVSQRPTPVVIEEGKADLQKIQQYNETTANKKNAYQTIYTLQTGSFIKIKVAQKQFNYIMQRLNENKLDYLRIEKVGKYYTVRLGKFEDYTAGEKFLQANKPQLPTAILMKAYIKDDRIIKIYE